MTWPKGKKRPPETVERMRRAHTGLTVYPVEERFFRKVDKGDGLGCWVWKGSTNEDGYGSFYYRGKVGRAHRASYSMFVGEIPKGIQVLHDCDNPSCVRPDHLFLGTQLDNIKDACAKGRNRNGMKGRRHSPEAIAKISKRHSGVKKTEEHIRRIMRTKRDQSKISDSDVEDMKRLRQGGWTYRRLGKRYGISTSGAYLIVSGKSRGKPI